MAEAWTPELKQQVQALATAAGFDLAGIAPAEGAPAAGTRSAAPLAARFDAWIEAGYAGEMEYLKRRSPDGTLLRSAVRVALPWARSLVVCALNYNAAAPRSIDPADAGAGWIARYAWSGKQAAEGTIPSDYHDDLLGRLRAIEAGLQERVACETRCYVDTGPIVERDFAARAGVGWIGKNTCVLNQELGSWLLLGVIATSLEVPEAMPPAVAVDRCGSCTRCIDACPTGALIAPRQMDASLCIAYLTIEKKGAIAEELRAPMGRQVFGCDICQDVCPWNRKAPVAATPGLTVRGALVNPSLAWLGTMGGAEFKAEFRGSPLERTKRHRLQRNVAIAMGNSGEREFLPQLERWREGEDAVLAEAAEWATARLRDGLEEPPASASID